MSNNLMVVGAATPETQRFLEVMTESSPIEVITAPLLILSAPGEYVSPDAVDYIDKKSNVLTVVPFSTPWVYNPHLGQTECIIACHAARTEMSVNMLRNEVLGVEGLKHFYAYFVLVYDPARTSSYRRFMNDLCSSLIGKALNFELAIADDSMFVYQKYNVIAQQQIAEAVQMPV